MTPLALSLVPAAGAAVIAIAGRVWRPHGPAFTRGLGAGAAAVLVATIALALRSAAHPVATTYAWWSPLVAATLAVSGIGRLIVVLVPIIALPVVLYAVTSMRDDPGRPRLVALLVGFTGAMELLVTAGDFLVLLVGWELVGITSWALIGYEWRDPGRVRQGRVAFSTTQFGDLGLYVAAGATFAATGTVRFTALGTMRGALLDAVAAGVLLAAAAKSAQLPFSPWLFAAMAGPTPASALLHSATMVAAGAYLLLRLAPLLAPIAWFAPAVAALGLATALAGGMVALLQPDLKKALAASTSAQYGLMLVAVGAGVPGAATLHLMTHAAFKALLFLGAGVVLHATGSLDLARMRLGRVLPRTAWLFGVGALALAAVPPLGGAYSKEQILAAAADGPGGAPWLAVGVLVAALLSAMYAGRLQLLAFGPGATATHASAPDRIVLAAMAFLAVASLALGALWIPAVSGTAAHLVGMRLAPAAGWEWGATLMTLAVATVVLRVAAQRDALLTWGVPARAREWIAGWLGLGGAARRLVAGPATRLAGGLALLDQRVIDAGIRATGWIAAAAARTLAWWGERGMEGMVVAITRGVVLLAVGSGIADDHGVDAAVERIGTGAGAAGRQSRRLQTGLAHQYYLVVGAGVLVVLAVATIRAMTLS